MASPFNNGSYMVFIWLMMANIYIYILHMRLISMIWLIIGFPEMGISSIAGWFSSWIIRF